jgi:hypothetical protein
MGERDDARIQSEALREIASQQPTERETKAEGALRRYLGVMFYRARNARSDKLASRAREVHRTHD